MPENKFQEIIFTILMAAAMVYGLVCYNISLELGGLSNGVFAMALGEWPLMAIAAILLELLFVGRLSRAVAFRLVNPAQVSPTPVMLAVSAASVWLMCPCMSLLASLLFKGGFQSGLLSIWIETTVLNFPMALLWQFFAAGPAVRLVFRLIFQRQTAAKP
ncbi:MAG TPA: DUF2798 domain-containing protein [Candidatus Agathobaculum stercoravium]|nr:DUF2798 domain-containing protein [uncultured Agathobaculum sp.]HIV97344.1 DUF2798 domain-containing protein [Candidatus Agathobaculum stercoravium]